MKQEQLQARDLYFQTGLTKTQISAILGVPRRTLHYWIRQNNWERQKQCAAAMPSLLAENCYHIMSNLTQSLLMENRTMKPVTRHEADTLYKLTLTVSKLKKQYTLNESLELFGLFMEHVNRSNEKMAQELSPIVDEYIAKMSAGSLAMYKPEGANDMGFIPMPQHDSTEARKDIDDIMAWSQHVCAPETDIPPHSDTSHSDAQAQGNGSHTVAEMPCTGPCTEVNTQVDDLVLLIPDSPETAISAASAPGSPTPLPARDILSMTLDEAYDILGNPPAVIHEVDTSELTPEEAEREQEKIFARAEEWERYYRKAKQAEMVIRYHINLCETPANMAA